MILILICRKFPRGTELYMYTIEVDFDVYRQLTARRSSEDVSYNDVIRELLDMAQSVAAQDMDESILQTPKDWVVRGVLFPFGTEFRGKYKGRVHNARVENGALVLNGKRFRSPSEAAASITGYAVDGWCFWECRLPGKSSWQLIENLRR